MLSDVRSGIFCDVFSIVLCGLLDIYLRIQLSPCPLFAHFMNHCEFTKTCTVIHQLANVFELNGVTLVIHGKQS